MKRKSIKIYGGSPRGAAGGTPGDPLEIPHDGAIIVEGILRSGRVSSLYDLESFTYDFVYDQDVGNVLIVKVKRKTSRPQGSRGSQPRWHRHARVEGFGVSPGADGSSGKVYTCNEEFGNAYTKVYSIEGIDNVSIKVYTDFYQYEEDFEAVMSKIFYLIPQFRESHDNVFGRVNCGIMQSYTNGNVIGSRMYKEGHGNKKFIILESFQPDRRLQDTEEIKFLTLLDYLRLLMKGRDTVKAPFNQLLSSINVLKVIAFCISQLSCLAEYGILFADFKPANIILSHVSYKVVPAAATSRRNSNVISDVPIAMQRGGGSGLETDFPQRGGQPRAQPRSEASGSAEEAVTRQKTLHAQRETEWWQQRETESQYRDAMRELERKNEQAEAARLTAEQKATMEAAAAESQALYKEQKATMEAEAARLTAEAKRLVEEKEAAEAARKAEEQRLAEQRALLTETRDQRDRRRREAEQMDGGPAARQERDSPQKPVTRTTIDRLFMIDLGGMEIHCKTFEKKVDTPTLAEIKNHLRFKKSKEDLQEGRDILLQKDVNDSHPSVMTIPIPFLQRVMDLNSPGHYDIVRLVSKELPLIEIIHLIHNFFISITVSMIYYGYDDGTPDDHYTGRFGLLKKVMYVYDGLIEVEKRSEYMKFRDDDDFGVDLKVLSGLLGIFNQVDGYDPVVDILDISKVKKRYLEIFECDDIKLVLGKQFELVKSLMESPLMPCRNPVDGMPSRWCPWAADESGTGPPTAAAAAEVEQLSKYFGLIDDSDI